MGPPFDGPGSARHHEGMSKSAKKQKERERARQAELAAGAPTGPEAFPAVEGAAAPPPAPRPKPAPAPEVQPPLSPKAAGATAVDEDLFETVAEAAMMAGEPREEGEAQAWVYNGDTLAIKYVEETDDTPRRLMVAAFRQGVVFQVEGDKQVVHRPGDWVQQLPDPEEPLNSA